MSDGTIRVEITSELDDGIWGIADFALQMLSRGYTHAEIDAMVLELLHEDITSALDDAKIKIHWREALREKRAKKGDGR